MRRLREATGLRQGQLAEELRVSRQTINAIETGRYLPSLPLAFAIARFFGRRIRRSSMTTLSRWFVRGIGILLGAAIGLAEWSRGGSAWQAVVAFAIVAGYSLVLRALQSRSDMVSLLSGFPATSVGRGSTSRRCRSRRR